MTLENITMLTNRNCKKCKEVELKLFNHDIDLKQIVNINSDEGIGVVIEHNVNVTPAFINTRNSEYIIGRTPIKKLKKLNTIV